MRTRIVAMVAAGTLFAGGIGAAVALSTGSSTAATSPGPAGSGAWEPMIGGGPGPGAMMRAMGGYPGQGPGASTTEPAGLAGSGPGAMMRANAGKVIGSMLAGRSPQTVSPQQARTLGDQIPTGATVDQAGNRLTFQTSTVNLVVVADPSYGPDMTFRIAGLTNPTIVVPTGAHVTVQLINGASDLGHGWLLIPAQSSIPEIPMLAAGPAFTGSFAHPLGDASSTSLPTETISFDASSSGQYLYVCPVPSHAQQGMHGQFIVQ